MVEMTVVLVVGAIAVVAAILVGLTWRRGGDERHSVNDYHHTLETLRLLAERNPGNGIRGSSTRSGSSSGSRGQPGHTNGSSGDPLAPAASRSSTLVSRSGPPGRAVYEDESAARASVFARSAPSSTVSKLASGQAFHQRRTRALSAATPQVSARGILVAAVVVVLIVVVAVGVALAPSHRSHNSGAPAASSKSSSTPSTHSSAPPTRSGSSGSARRGTSASTVPPSLQATTSSTTSADYPAPGSSYTLTLSASGACWILAEATSSGDVLWTGTLEPGQTQQIAATGSTSVRLGAAFDVSVSVNGVPVALPSDHGSPFDLDFQAA